MQEALGTVFAVELVAAVCEHVIAKRVSTLERLVANLALVRRRFTVLH